METPQKTFTILSPQSGSDANYFIDWNFQREVLLHFIKNKIGMNTPLILGVQGKAGEGKSTHIIQICSKCGITMFLLHGSSLNGNFEGEPVNIINDMYIAASEYSKKSHTMILVDDIDTSIASTSENREYTVNSQLINGAFMNIANSFSNIESENINRVPIIFTGNNLMNLYAPLRRTGRMRLYTWSPNNEQKTEIIGNLYKDIIGEKEKEEFFEIIRPHIDEPISFFVDLKSNLFDDIIVETIMENNGVFFEKINRAVRKAKNTYDWLSKIAIDIKLLANNKMQDFNR